MRRLVRLLLIITDCTLEAFAVFKWRRVDRLYGPAPETSTDRTIGERGPVRPDPSSVRRVKQEADRLGLSTKRSTTAGGIERGGRPFSRGHIYHLLSNPIYIGEIAHKGQLYPGQHPALIDADTWAAVRDQLAANARDHRRKAHATEPSLLAGVLVDARGERLTPSHAVKKGRRYRYYVSTALITEPGTDRPQGWRLAAQEIEDAVIKVLSDANDQAGDVARAL
jgi:site-specific DNA recombinase